MEEPPAPLLNGSPAGAALKAKTKKSEEKGFFWLCIIAVQPHLFFAARVASSTRHRYSYSVQHLRVTGDEWQRDGAWQKGASRSIVPPRSWKSGEFHHRPLSPPAKDNWPQGVTL